MKNLKFIPILLLALTLNLQLFGATMPVEDVKTAETVFAFAENMEPFDAEIFKAELVGMSTSEKIKLIKISIDVIENSELSTSVEEADIAYYILAVLLPPAAVGLHTDWSMPVTLYSVGWTILGWLPGVIHAFIVLGR